MITPAWVNKINLLIAKGSHNDALAMIEKIVDWIFCEPINVGQVFGSAELDRLCQQIGAACLEKLKNKKLSSLKETNNTSRSTTVYLTSRLQASGGHTAALADIIRLSPSSPSVVIVTGACGYSERNALEQKLDGKPNVTIEYVPAGNHLSKLEWIQLRLAELSPKTVWLFNHHQDSVAIAAVQPGQGYQLKFYHHGDHHLCLGVYLDYAEHIDPHPMGFHNCRNNLGIKNNHYLPLTVRDHGDRPAGQGFLNGGGLVTCTVANFNKVEVPYFIQYVDVIPEILQITGGQHIHIGKLTRLARRRIRRGLAKHGINPNSFVYVPYVPSVWRAMHDYGVDLYIASFPYGGGRALIEAMGAGIPVVVHKHHTSRMLGGFDLTYEEAMTWRYPEELYAHLRNLDADTLTHQGKNARDWYEKYHREEILQAVLSGQRLIDIPLLKTDFQPDSLIQALQNCSEVSLRGLLRRVLWRNYRRWRSKLGRMI